jgi:hypothetical protein
MTAEEARKISENNSRLNLINKIIETAFVEIEKAARNGLYQIYFNYKDANQEDLIIVSKKLNDLGYRCYLSRREINGTGELNIKWNL